MHPRHPPHPLHAHVSPGDAAEANERRTRLVVGLTALMMVVEIVVGYATSSMALLADGWHMATHVGALGFSALAYWYARAQAGSARYTFGTGKVYALSGFTSALLLLVVALFVVFDAAHRLVSPVEIAFVEALPVAILGLVVNLVSAVLLHDGGSSHAHGEHAHGHAHHDHAHHDHAHHDHAHHDHAHHDHAHHDHAHHDHARAQGAHAHDHNMRAAYLHVLADAVTSVFAIAALVVGHFFAIGFVDALAAIVSSLVIVRWSLGLLRETVGTLLDVAPDDRLPAAIRDRLERIDDTRVVDLHLWEMGLGQKGCIVSLVTSTPRALDAYRAAVLEVASVAHLTVEIECCMEAH